MGQNQIRRSDLHNSLVRAAMVRSGVTMLLSPLLLVIGGLIGQIPQQKQAQELAMACGAILFFGGFIGISAIMTEVWCRPRVLCPHCGISLWECGTGSFKPRRMKVRPDAVNCPGCQAPIVPVGR